MFTHEERNFMRSVIENGTFHGSIVEAVASCKTALAGRNRLEGQNLETAYRCLMSSNIPASKARFVGALIDKFENIPPAHVQEAARKDQAAQTGEGIMCGIPPEAETAA